MSRLAAGVAAGSALWLLTAAAISARTGTSLLQLSGAGATAAAGDAVGSSPLSGLLFGELLQRPGDPGQWVLVLLTSALSPAGEAGRRVWFGGRAGAADMWVWSGTGGTLVGAWA